MDEIGSAAAVVLAALLGWAGVAKLRAPAATAASFRALGFRGAVPLSRAVPVVELVCGLLLVVRPRFGGWVGFGLLIVFTAVLLPSVLQGREVACGCFGASASSKVRPSTLLRNGGLIAAAIAATTTPRIDLGWAGTIIVGTTFVCVAVVGSLVDLRREVGPLLWVAASDFAGRPGMPADGSSGPGPVVTS